MISRQALLSDPAVEGLLLRLVLTLEDRAAQNGLGAPDLLAALTEALAARPPRPPPACKGGLAGWRLKRVTAHMAGRLEAGIDLAELPALAGLSRAQFFRAFKQSAGLTPHRYLTTLRLDRARALLDAGADDVAARVGLSPARLTTLFKQRFGISPLRYQRSRRVPISPPRTPQTAIPRVYQVTTKAAEVSGQ